jgi:DNA primase
VDEVVLCFDADAAGKKAAERSLEALLQNDLIVRVAEMPAGEDPDSLIRRKGRKEFEKRIAAAQAFFDYWIESEVATSDLNSLAAKMQLARKLGETVSRVRDPLMRGEIVSQMSARLGVSPADFERLVPKQKSEGFSGSQGLRSQASPAPRHDIAMLCVLALRDEEARDFLHGQNWREILAQVPDAEILVRILESELRPSDAASLNAFLATLSAIDEGLVSSWLLQKVPPNVGIMVEKWWLGVRQAVLRRHLEVAKGRIKLSGLTTGDVVNLQKEILDLQEQLHELSPARKADS